MTRKTGRRSPLWFFAAIGVHFGLAKEAFGQEARADSEGSFFYVQGGTQYPLRPRVDRFHLAVDSQAFGADLAAEDLLWDGDRLLTRKNRSGARSDLICEPADKSVDGILLRINSYRQDPRVRIAGPVFDLGGNTDGLPHGNTAELYNNIVVAAAGICIDVDGPLLSNNNSLFGAIIGRVGPANKVALSDWRSAVFADKDSISANPDPSIPNNPAAFTDTLYGILATSPYVNRGKAAELVTGRVYPYDFFGNSRVAVGEVDIGAREQAIVDLGEAFIRGDTNEDGDVNLSDVLWIYAFLFDEGEASTCLDTNDVDDNDVITITDAIYLSACLFNTGDGAMRWIPVPWPDCGVDPYGFEIFCSIGSPLCP